MSHNALTPAPPLGYEMSVEQMSLLPTNEPVVIDGSYNVRSAESIGLQSRVDTYTVSVIGEFAIPDTNEVDKRLALLKVNDAASGKTEFALQGLIRSGETGGHVALTKPVILREDEVRLIGRQANAYRPSETAQNVSSELLWGSGTTYGSAVSGKHLKFLIKDGNIIVTDTSANGTRMNAVHSPYVEESVSTTIDEATRADHVYQHTGYALERARDHGALDQEAQTFGNRIIVTRDTPIVDGVVDIRARYAGKTGGEAIVVDSTDERVKKSYNDLLQSFEDKILDVRSETGMDPTQEEVIVAIYKAVDEAMDYDLDYVNNYAAELAAKGPSLQKAQLSVYLNNKKGVCRHMALASAWLGNKVAKSGLIDGVFTAEVNQTVLNPAAHEWARFTAPDGTVYIIDPAQKFVGTLDEAIKRKNGWEYRRESELTNRQKRASEHIANILPRQ